MKWLLLLSTVALGVAFGWPRPAVKGVTVDPNGASVNNSEVPGAFNSRALYTGAMSTYNFQNVVCHIFAVEHGDSLRPLPGVIYPTNSTKCTVALIDKGASTYYHSRIQKGAEGFCNYLTFASKLGARQMVDFTMYDDAVASAGPIDAATYDSVVAWAKAHPRRDTTEKRIWVTEVVRTRTTTVRYDTVQANAGVQFGELVGVGGSVYRRSELGSQGFAFGYVACDIDGFVATTTTDKSGLESLEVTWEPRLYTKPIAGTKE